MVKTRSESRRYRVADRLVVKAGRWVQSPETDKLQNREDYNKENSKKQEKRKTAG